MFIYMVSPMSASTRHTHPNSSVLATSNFRPQSFEVPSYKSQSAHQKTPSCWTSELDVLVSSTTQNVMNQNVCISFKIPLLFTKVGSHAASPKHQPSVTCHHHFVLWSAVPPGYPNQVKPPAAQITALFKYTI